MTGTGNSEDHDQGSEINDLPHNLTHEVREEILLAWAKRQLLYNDRKLLTKPFLRAYVSVCIMCEGKATLSLSSLPSLASTSVRSDLI